MSEKDMNAFAASNKSREKAGKDMAPVIEKIEAEFALVLAEARTIKERANEVLKFETERAALERQVRELRRELHETNTHVASVKAEGELAQAKLGSACATTREELQSLERTVSRREDYFQAYDRKLNSVMDSLSKHQAYINDRMFVFEDKFKQLSRETLEMAREVKKDFETTATTNLLLRNELVHKIRHTEEKEKILDLYMSEREEIPRKLHQIYDDLRNCLRQNEFQEFRTWHEKAMDESLSRVNTALERVLPPQTQQALKGLEQRFSEVEAMRRKVEEIEQVRASVEELGMKMDQLERKEDHKLVQFRQETEEMEEKIIEVIDKKIETIEEEIEHYNIENEESVDEKIQKLKDYLLALINEPRAKSEHSLPAQPTTYVPVNHDHTAVVSAELLAARREREAMEKHAGEIKTIAEGLTSKLNLFSNRITMCKSDIEIFTEGTGRELKRISELRREEETHMEKVGEMVADLTEALLLLTSLALYVEQPTTSDHRTFVTFQDGIILELDKGDAGQVNYRRFQATPAEFKESLLLALINQVDNLTAGNTIFKWDRYHPSAFFSKVRDNLILKSKKANRSPSAHVGSPRRKPKKAEDEDLFFDLKMESEELLKASAQKPKIVVNNSTLILTNEKPRSEMQIRYKLRKQEERSKKEEERNCFTASRSHRKTKISFN